MENTSKKLLRQGKTKKQYKDSAKATFYGWCGVVFMVIMLFLFTFLTGCATTQETSKECCKSEKTSTK